MVFTTLFPPPIKELMYYVVILIDAKYLSQQIDPLFSNHFLIKKHI